MEIQQLNLGQVAFNPKGNWNADATYKRLNVVYYKGRSYYAKQENTNQPPSLQSEYWGLMVDGGDVTNNPDEEDMTSMMDEDGKSVIKFADRAYDPDRFSGKGYKILRKNMQNVRLAIVTINVTKAPTADGELSVTINNIDTHVTLSATDHNTTTLTAQAIADALTTEHEDYDVVVSESTVKLTRKFGEDVPASAYDVAATGMELTLEDSVKTVRRNLLTPIMVNKPNTIYEIRYDFDLNGGEIEVPEGCTLKFEGGMLRNGTLKLNNAFIDSSPMQIFKSIALVKTKYNDIICERNGVYCKVLHNNSYFDLISNTICDVSKTYTINALIKLSNSILPTNDKIIYNSKEYTYFDSSRNKYIYDLNKFIIVDENNKIQTGDYNKSANIKVFFYIDNDVCDNYANIKNEYVYPEWFGNDTLALKTALLFNTVYLLNKTYTINDTLLLKKNTIIGNNSVLLMTENKTGIIVDNVGTNGADNFNIKDITICTENYSSKSEYYGKGIEIRTCWNKANIINVSTFGFEVGLSIMSYRPIQGMYFEQISSKYANVGILIDNIFGFYNSYNYVNANKINPNFVTNVKSYAIEIHGGVGNTILGGNSEITGKVISIYVDNSELLIDGCIWEERDGIKVVNDSFVNISNSKHLGIAYCDNTSVVIDLSNNKKNNILNIQNITIDPLYAISFPSKNNCIINNESYYIKNTFKNMSNTYGVTFFSKTFNEPLLNKTFSIILNNNSFLNNTNKKRTFVFKLDNRSFYLDFRVYKNNIVLYFLTNGVDKNIQYILKGEVVNNISFDNNYNIYINSRLIYTFDQDVQTDSFTILFDSDIDLLLTKLYITNFIVNDWCSNFKINEWIKQDESKTTNIPEIASSSALADGFGKIKDELFFYGNSRPMRIGEPTLLIDQQNVTENADHKVILIYKRALYSGYSAEIYAISKGYIKEVSSTLNLVISDGHDYLTFTGSYLIGNNINVILCTYNGVEYVGIDTCINDVYPYIYINKKISTFEYIIADYSEISNVKSIYIQKFNPLCNDISELNIITGIKHISNGNTMFSIIHKKPFWYYNNNWFDSNGVNINTLTKGTTSQRPTNISEGFEYYDSTLKKKILWNGTAWVNMDGSSLAEETSISDSPSSEETV